MTVRITNDHLDKFIVSLENKWPRKKSFMRRRVILETSPDSITASQQLRDSKLRFALKKKKKFLWLGRCWKCWVSTNQDPNKANPRVSVPHFMKHAVKKVSELPQTLEFPLSCCFGWFQTEQGCLHQKLSSTMKKRTANDALNFSCPNESLFLAIKSLFLNQFFLQPVVQSLYPAYRFPATPDIPLAFLSLSPFQTRFKFLNSSSFHPPPHPHPPPPSPQSPSFSQRMWETLRHADCLGPISHSLFNYTGMPRSCKCLRKSTVSRLKHCLKHKPVHFSVCNMTASCTYNKKT